MSEGVVVVVVGVVVLGLAGAIELIGCSGDVGVVCVVSANALTEIPTDKKTRPHILTNFIASSLIKLNRVIIIKYSH
ncbi:MAG: hypothetical protein COY58_04120 [Gammaproteobacteria bacterium CG_4_10_14_0_8_um_filter_38_16]|nr:MAG: hypothetical protein COY58_04120 [Gammaproteobacteria bacterium CG_4_10_14_0_8_um_filter_38_16]PJA02731.1 MAG: hypothetical protein COX72_08955 [Gammaproteobacteria bacterium CG_4_10_14_0_2_um_filter_38_22]PJB09809.1 MAG: hypothetical protein CO120_08245 [Gammaproteobacteria bacterium CG_4_9_14_3_um_filter_38_9]